MDKHICPCEILNPLGILLMVVSAIGIMYLSWWFLIGVILGFFCYQVI